MPSYAIGDLQGCRGAFEALLDKINFRADRDQLYLAGDLVNRGPDSLGTLRRVYDMRDNVSVVLGNHDLHLLALAQRDDLGKRKDTLTDILDAPDREPLLSWLIKQPLLVELPDFNAVMTHAGIPPLWTLEQAAARAREVQEVMSTAAQRAAFFSHMYGNHPAGWRDDLKGPDRWRVITNYFTRMRFVDMQGALDLSSKGEADTPPDGFMPWFQHPQRQVTDVRILFGHWAALEGKANVANVEALDTGCVWGGCLTALCLQSGQRMTIQC